MASTSDTIGGSTKKQNSIVIVDMPVELINRDILKQHFEQFGTVARLACSVSKKYAIIHFSTSEEAENAAANGAVIKPDAPPLKIVNRDTGELQPKSSSSAPAPVPNASSTRLVTRRKIVRTFSNTGGSSNSSTSLVRDSSFTPKPESSSSKSKYVESTENYPSPSTSAAAVQLVHLEQQLKSQGRLRF